MQGGHRSSVYKKYNIWDAIKQSAIKVYAAYISMYTCVHTHTHTLTYVFKKNL